MVLFFSFRLDFYSIFEYNYIGEIMIDRIKKIGIFVLLFIIFLYNDLFYLVPLKLLNVDLKKLSYKASLIGSLISSLILIVILIVIYRKYLKEKFKDYKKHLGEYFDFGMKWWIVGLLAMMVFNVLITTLTPLKNANNEVLVDNMLKMEPFLAFLSATFTGPIIEEMIFRKSFADMFKNKWLMVFASGLVFGLLHVIFSFKSPLDFLYVLPYGALGGVFAYMLKEKDNVLIPITFHILHNGILTLLSIITMGL